MVDLDSQIKEIKEILPPSESVCDYYVDCT